MSKPSSTYLGFIAYGERCKTVWRQFKESFQDPGLKEFLKESYPVLSSLSGHISLDGLDVQTIASSSPGSFVPNEASKSLIAHIRLLESLKKDNEASGKTERGRVEKWLREFDRQKLEFEEHQLEVRFASLRMDLIQEIKRSSFVDSNLTSVGLVSIRIVLKVPVEP